MTYAIKFQWADDDLDRRSANRMIAAFVIVALAVVAGYWL